MRQSAMTQSGVVESWAFTSFVHSQRNQSLRFRNVTGRQDSCSCWRNVILWSANENRITRDEIQWYDLLVGFIHGNSPSPLYPAFMGTLFQKMRETTSSWFVTSCSMNRKRRNECLTRCIQAWQCKHQIKQQQCAHSGSIKKWPSHTKRRFHLLP
jgi:hypothetical protein